MLHVARAAANPKGLKIDSAKRPNTDLRSKIVGSALFLAKLPFAAGTNAALVGLTRGKVIRALRFALPISNSAW